MTDCIFCKMTKGEMDTELLIEKENLVVVADINPKAPAHYLIIPRKHIPTISDAEEEDKELLGDMILTAKEAAKKLDIDQGYKLVFNVGEHGGQEVFHIHLHLLGGWSN